MRVHVPIFLCPTYSQVVIETPEALSLVSLLQLVGYTQLAKTAKVKGKESKSSTYYRNSAFAKSIELE